MGAMDALRCRYTDCRERHPVASGDEQITCPTCRDWMGLPPLGARPIPSAGEPSDA